MADKVSPTFAKNMIDAHRCVRHPDSQLILDPVWPFNESSVIGDIGPVGAYFVLCAECIKEHNCHTIVNGGQRVRIGYQGSHGVMLKDTTPVACCIKHSKSEVAKQMWKRAKKCKCDQCD